MAGLLSVHVLFNITPHNSPIYWLNGSVLRSSFFPTRSTRIERENVWEPEDRATDGRAPEIDHGGLGVSWRHSLPRYRRQIIK